MTGTRTRAPLHEPSAWLRLAVGRRLRQMAEARLDLQPDEVAVCPIGGTGALGSRQDRTCDRCQTYVAPGLVFYPFIYRVGAVILTGGLCRSCRDRELGASA